MKQAPSFQPSQIPSPRKNMKFTLRKVTLAIGIFLAINILFVVFNSVTNEYSQIQKNYKNAFKEGEGFSNPIRHYRINTNSVYFYENCSSPFTKWCKHKLEGVKPGDFVPLNKDFAKIYKNDEVFIYQANLDVTDKVAAPEQFRALEKLESDPQYFSDGKYLYYLGNYRWGIGADNVEQDSFPIKITDNDLYDTPPQFQSRYDMSVCQSPVNYTRILFLNNKVYLDGVLLPEADAETFEEISFDSMASTVGPWFRDKNRVYLDGHVIVGADPNTIKIHNRNESHNNSCSDSYARIASDKTNVYYANLEPYLIICDNGKAFCNIDIKIPGISPSGLTVDSVMGKYALRDGVTISNNDGIFYLDGLKAHSNEPVRVLVEKNWGKEHHEVNAIKNRYKLHYKANIGQCSVKDTVRTEKKFDLYVNDELLGDLEFCDRYFDVFLHSGINTIKVLSESGQVVFEREFIAEN